MVFSPRLKQILLVMLKEDKVLSVKNLAQQINVSKRTVQRELEFIDSSLKKYGIQFVSKTGIGIWLEGEAEAKKTLMQELLDNEEVDLTDKEDRRKRLILEMLKDKSPRKLYYFSNLFGVSEATISNDMEAIAGWFEEFHLNIIRKQGYGVTVMGSEKDYRQAMRTFVDENIESKMIKEMYENQGQSYVNVIARKDEKNVYGILDDDILKRVINCVLSLGNKRILALTENSFIGLILHITIAINRIVKAEIIEHNEELMKMLQRDDDYEFALYIVESLEKEFQISIPEIEAAYICLHIKASKRQFIDVDEKSNLLYYEGQGGKELINEMIDAYDREISYELKRDEEFISGLLAHLQPTFIRLKNSMKIGNPLLAQIKENYAQIYDKCVNVGKVMGERLDCEVPDTEIGFLTIHFGAAIVRMENKKEVKRKVRIGIVCASGIGISRLMLTKLVRYLEDRAEITTYGKEDVTPYVTDKTDFFVSSITFEFEGADILYVRPLLLDEDMEKIEKRIRIYERMPKQEAVEDEFSRQLEQVNFIAAQIKTLIKNLECMKVDSRITFDELLVAISEKLSPDNEKRILIQEDIRNRENLASQIIPEFGIALLHTRTKGVLKPNFSICVTKDKTAFEDAYFKGIRAVIVMLVPQDEHVRENSDIFGYLSTRLVEDEEFIETIIRGEAEEIKAFFIRLLKKYFNQYLERA